MNACVQFRTQSLLKRYTEGRQCFLSFVNAVKDVNSALVQEQFKVQHPFFGEQKMECLDEEDILKNGLSR
jgi:hypothetical protein